MSLRRRRIKEYLEECFVHTIAIPVITASPMGTIRQKADARTRLMDVLRGLLATWVVLHPVPSTIAHANTTIIAEILFMEILPRFGFDIHFMPGKWMAERNILLSPRFDSLPQERSQIQVISISELLILGR